MPEQPRSPDGVGAAQRRGLHGAREAPLMARVTPQCPLAVSPKSERPHSRSLRSMTWSDSAAAKETPRRATDRRSTMFAKTTKALVTALIIASAALGPALAGPGYINEVNREAACASGCSGGN